MLGLINQVDFVVTYIVLNFRIAKTKIVCYFAINLFRPSIGILIRHVRILKNIIQVDQKVKWVSRVA